jgi:chloride channel 7
VQDVIAYLNGLDVLAVFLFRTLVAKVLGSLGSVGGGLAIGKEGPFVHIGACIASLLSQVRPQRVPNLACITCL